MKKKMENKLKDNTVSLSDLALIAYLCVMKVPLLNVRKDKNSSRVNFSFADSEEVEQLRLEFLNDGPVPARSYFYTLNDLKRKIRECIGDK